MPTRLTTARPTTARIEDGILGPYIVSPADPFVERMEEEDDSFDRLVLAARALRRDPGCIEAHLPLSECSPDDATRLKHLELAVATGDQLFKPVAERYGDDMCWWGYPGTRPYMCAIHALALARLEMGDAAAAKRGFKRLLRMNPYDNQGARFGLESLETAAAPRI